MVNVMDEYINYTDKCLNRYLKMIFGNKYNADIAKGYIDAYLSVRYSNYLDSSTVKLTLSKKISQALDDANKELISKMEKDDDSENLINSYRIFSGYFYNLDQLYLLESQRKTIDKIEEEREKILDFKDKEFNKEFNNLLRVDIKNKKDFLDAFESPTFRLRFEPLDKNLSYAKLENSIQFPELYSEIAIKKAAQKDSIGEDLTSITFLLAAHTIANDLIACDFDKEYMVDLPDSYFDKKTKIKGLFNIIDNLFIQDKLRICITYKCFMRYKSYVRDYMKDGYVFTIKLDDTFDYSSENIEYLELFDKILLEKDKYYYKDMKKNGKIKDRIISVDEVV